MPPRNAPILLGIGTSPGNPPTWRLVDDRGVLRKQLGVCATMLDRTADDRRAVCAQQGTGRRLRRLESVNLRTGAVTAFLQLPETSELQYAQWSPDGKRVVTTILEGTAPTYRNNVVIVEVATGKTRQITSFPFVDSSTTSFDEIRQPHSPQWSPDGKKVYYAVERGEFGESLRVVDLATGADRQLVAGADREFAVSRDGRRIAFRHRSGAIRQIDAEGDSLGSIAPNGSVVFGWSPDNRKLAFVSGDFRSGYRGHVYDARTRRTTTFPQELESNTISFAPDSARVVVTTRSRGTEILDLRGRLLRRILGPRKGFAASWTP